MREAAGELGPILPRQERHLLRANGAGSGKDEPVCIKCDERPGEHPEESGELRHTWQKARAAGELAPLPSLILFPLRNCAKSRSQHTRASSRQAVLLRGPGGTLGFVVFWLHNNPRLSTFLSPHAFPKEALSAQTERSRRIQSERQGPKCFATSSASWGRWGWGVRSRFLLTFLWPDL